MRISALHNSFCFICDRRATHSPAQMVVSTKLTNGRNSDVLCMTTCSRVSSLCSLGAICTSSKWLAVAGQAAIGFSAAPDFICIQPTNHMTCQAGAAQPCFGSTVAHSKHAIGMTVSMSLLWKQLRPVNDRMEQRRTVAADTQQTRTTAAWILTEFGDFGKLSGSAKNC